MVLRDLEELRASRGYLRLRETADEIAWQNYNRMLSNKSNESDAYFKGQIAGLESLFQNFNHMIADFKDYIEGIEEIMLENGEEVNGD